MPAMMRLMQDKDGNVLTFGGSTKSDPAPKISDPAPPPDSSGADVPAVVKGKEAPSSTSEDHGAALRAAVQRSLAEGGAAGVNAKDDAKVQAAKEADARNAEASAAREREDKEIAVRKEREAKEVEERRREEELKARREVEERARAEAAERKAAEERRKEERKAAAEARQAKAKGSGGSLSSFSNRIEAKEMADKEAGLLDSAAKTAVAAGEDRKDAPPPPRNSAPSPAAPAAALSPIPSAPSAQQTPQDASSATPLRPGGFRPGMGTPMSGLRPGGLRPGMGTPSSAVGAGSASAAGDGRASKKRRVWSKEQLMSFRDLDACCIRPSDLPDMTIQRGGGGGGRGNGGGGGRGGGWQRGNAPPPGRGGGRRQSHGNHGGGGGEWSRGHAPPRHKGGKGRNDEPDPNFLDDGTPVIPLGKTDKRWVPVKSNSAMVLTEKQVRGLLNKMTKEKFERLSTQMCEIPILSYEMLTMMIGNVYEKAIFEPAFGDMYAELCVRLSQTANKASFVKIIESDEEPEGGTEGGGSSDIFVYRWSNDVDVNDDEVVGPFEDPKDCIAAAMDPGHSPDPAPRGEQELVLDSVKIRRGTFIKILRSEGGPEGDKYYTVFFDLDKAKEFGQQMSDIFLSEREAVTDGIKQNSFKRPLLNKCEDEFNKQDFFVQWKKEMAEFEASKASLTEAELTVKEQEFEFRRIKIKKQVLGNIHFIGELYKKEMLKEKIMRYCIHSLMKLEEDPDSGKLRDIKGDLMDEEDNEALCSLFTTIGKTMDHPGARKYMEVYFKKMAKMSEDKRLSARSRFMYKDLIELRGARWKARREKESAKTLDEIKKDVEREERKQAQQSGRGRGGRGGGDYRGGDRRDNRGGDRRDHRRDRDSGGNSGSRGDGGGRRQSSSADDKGFTVVKRGQAVPRGGGGGSGGRSPPARSSVQGSGNKVISPTPKPAAVSSGGLGNDVTPLSKDKLKLKIKNMQNEFMADKNVKELLLTMDELSGTPDSGKTVVQVTTDTAMDCKDAVRESIIDMLAVLGEKGKLTRSDFEPPMGELVEFIESFVIDSPRAFTYLGDMLARFIGVKVLDVPWLSQQCKKLKELDAGTSAPEKVIAETIDSMTKRNGGGADLAKASFGVTSQASLEALLGADKWSAMRSEKLG